MSTSLATAAERKFLNNDQAADLLGISRRTLPIWRIQGRGPKFIKVGKLVRYDLSEVNAWVQANERSHTGRNNAMSY